MTKNTYIARSRGVSRLYAHLVLTTKFRLEVMPDEMVQRLQEIMQNLCEKWQCELIECNGEANHLHLVFRYAPQLQLSKFIDNVKSVSSRWVRKEFEPLLRKAYWNWDKGFWNESYSIDSVGFTRLDVLERYVRSQQGGL